MRRADPRDIRRHNHSLVLREVAERGPRSRATLALETGLNKSTVSSLVAELTELGLVRESGKERPGAVGRRCRDALPVARDPPVLVRQLAAAAEIRSVKRHETLTVRYGDSSRRTTAPRRARVASKMEPCACSQAVVGDVPWHIILVR